MLFIDALASVDEMAAFGALGTTPKVCLCTSCCAAHSWEQLQQSNGWVGACARTALPRAASKRGKFAAQTQTRLSGSM